MRILLLLSVFSLVACSGPTNRPNKYPKPVSPPDSPNPMERNRLGEGKPLLRVVPLHPHYYEPPVDFARLPKHPGNQHYKLVHRYELGDASRPRRLTISPNGKGIAISPDGADRVIVLYDVDDLSSEHVVHLPKPKNIDSPHEYTAYDVAWCGGGAPTLYVAAVDAMWALDPKTLKTLPGWPIRRTEKERIWRVICLADGAAATIEGIGGYSPTGSITVFERNGIERFSRWVSDYRPRTLALTSTGLILTTSQHGILLLDPNNGNTIHKARLGDLGRYVAASPTKPIIAIDNDSQPFQASIPELRFRPFPDIVKLQALDKINANDRSIPMKSDSHRLPIDTIDMMNYSRDGRDLIVVGRERTGTGFASANVAWVLRDGKLYDTLVGHLGRGTDVHSLSNGRIVTITEGTTEILIWQHRKTTESTNQPSSPQAAD